MREYIVPIVVALLGLCGTIAGLLFAYRKWVQERRTERAKPFTDDRQKAYREMWERVEQLNVDGRIEEITDDDFSRRIAKINAFLMTSNMYIDNTDRALVNSYIRGARAFHAAIRSSGDVGANLALGDTAEIPDEVLQQSRALLETHKEALALRTSFLEKVRAVLAGRIE